jgi:competence protein ComEC
MKKIKNTILSLLVILLLTACSKKEEKLTWTAINVNQGVQGDAHLISKNGKHILIDAGAWKVAKTVLVPTLQKHGVKEIEALLITHPHFDHYGGTMAILQSGIHIKHIYMNMPTPQQMQNEWWGGEYKHLVGIQNDTKAYGTQVHPIEVGEFFRFDTHSYLETLYIYDGINTPVGKTDINDMSAIVMLHDYNNRYLFTGDLNRKLSKYLATKPNIKADILKFPHHGVEGFATNAFIKAVDAKAMIVPGRDYLWCSKRAKRARELSHTIPTYINGFHGDITVTSGKEGYTITTEHTPEKLCKTND